jgi:hypothetical protein
MSKTKEEIKKEKHLYWVEYYKKNRDKLLLRSRENKRKNRQWYLDYSKEYHKRDYVIAKEKEYYQKPDYKQHKREYTKKHRQIPEVRERNIVYMKKYHPLYHQKNKDKNCKKSHDYYWANRNKISSQGKEYRGRPEVKKHYQISTRLYREKPENKKRNEIMSKKYRNGEITSPTILEMERRIGFIRELYLQKNYDIYGIAKKLNTSKSIISAVLRRNSISIKPKIFCNKRAIPCSNGLLVKSNSERVIVETLLQKGINFVYEPHLPDTRFIPDFYLPDRDLFVEFAGLTDKKWYVEQLEKKRKAYQDLQKNVSFITKPEQIVEVLA